MSGDSQNQSDAQLENVGRVIITSMLSIYDLVGLVGIALSIGCYARVQWQRDYAKQLSYSILNFLSAALLGISILHNWNLSSFIGNAFWMVISVYGIYRCLKYKRSAKNSDQQPILTAPP